METEKSWIMDLGYSYSMSLKKEYFEVLWLKLGGVIRLSNNKTCKVYGIVTVRLKMFDNCNFLLLNMRYVEVRDLEDTEAPASSAIEGKPVVDQDY